MFIKVICKRRFLNLLIAIFISVGLMVCGSSPQITQPVIQETKEQDAFPTKIPTIIEIQPTGTLVNLSEVTPTSDVIESNILDELRKRLAYGGGGGGGETGLQCEEPTSPPRSSLPAIQGACRFRDCLIEDTEHTCDEDTFVLYLFGFPFYQVIQLELYDPSGKLAGIDEFIVEEFDNEDNSGWIRSLNYDNVSRGYATTIGGIEVLKIELWMPDWQPTGVWHAVARSENLLSEGSFTVQNRTRFPGLYVIPGFFENPFGSPYQEYNFSAGQEFYVMGAGFQPEETYALGIYYIVEGQAELIDGLPVKADENGIFFASIVIEKSYPAGRYIAYIDFDLSYMDAAFAGVDVSFTVPNWQPCPDGSLSYLGPKDQARVNDKSPTPVTLRAKPTTQAEIFGQLQPGEYVYILEGPECQEGMVWWFVEGEESGQQGWIPEADSERHWLVTW